jgi:hypothetical protein
MKNQKQKNSQIPAWPATQLRRKYNITPKMEAMQRMSTPSIQPNLVMAPAPPPSFGEAGDCAFCTYRDFYHNIRDSENHGKEIPRRQEKMLNNR